jgi:hypothetical protein
MIEKINERIRIAFKKMGRPGLEAENCGKHQSRLKTPFSGIS